MTAVDLEGESVMEAPKTASYYTNINILTLRFQLVQGNNFCAQVSVDAWRKSDTLVCVLKHETASHPSFFWRAALSSGNFWDLSAFYTGFSA